MSFARDVATVSRIGSPGSIDSSSVSKVNHCSYPISHAAVNSPREMEEPSHFHRSEQPSGQHRRHNVNVILLSYTKTPSTTLFLLPRQRSRQTLGV